MVEELKRENALLREKIRLLESTSNTIIKNKEEIIKIRKELSIGILNQVLEYSAWGRLFNLKSWAKNILNQLENEQD